MATAFIHSFSYAHIIILSWCLPACEANNSWPEKKCKGMQTTESVQETTRKAQNEPGLMVDINW